MTDDVAARDPGESTSRLQLPLSGGSSGAPRTASQTPRMRSRYTTASC